MSESRNAPILVRTLGACLVVLLLLLACRDADRATAPPVATRPATQTIGLAPEALVGQWSPVYPAPIVQLHLHLLPDGRVLGFGHAGVPQVWDPATGTFTAVPSPSLEFCAGHTFLPDGRLLVVGGHQG